MIHRFLKATSEYLYFYEELDMYSEELAEDDIVHIQNKMKVATRLWAEIMPYADRVVACR